MWPFKTTKPSVPSAPQLPQVISGSAPAAHPKTANVPVVMERPAPQSIDVKSENIRSVIAPGEEFQGTLRLQLGIKIDGLIHGDIEFGLTDGMLVLNPKGVVEGNISGPRAIIVGEVRGNVVISGRLIVLSTARIFGDIAAGTLQLHEGAKIDGRIRTLQDMQAALEPEVPAEEPPAPAQPEVLQFISRTGTADHR